MLLKWRTIIIKKESKYEPRENGRGDTKWLEDINILEN